MCIQISAEGLFLKCSHPIGQVSYVFILIFTYLRLRYVYIHKVACDRHIHLSICLFFLVNFVTLCAYICHVVLMFVLADMWSGAFQNRIVIHLTQLSM